MQTKYGNATFVESKGYYILSKGEYRNKLLHRVIFEDTYGKIPEGWDVHHHDFNKLNNDPSNLVALPHWVHAQLHNRGENNHQWNEYARIVKDGKNHSGTQQYNIRYLGKLHKRSVNKDKLVDYCINELGLTKEDIKI